VYTFLEDTVVALYRTHGQDGFLGLESDMW
jgi:hypothetical protein